ncbi:glycogen/starch synthase, ADP-glucose type [Sphaerochaeta pleomorpha str. Grapes]|uniref:Glycogen synthase n=1 Tax=Sphaerochaeta pleomorpha (strain ATCC BAA-1885 / DSM 22778 / Grapes) TaxID=158190 RepID=G8QYG9_SPHPG|nr:glycogen/starch synthase [Sphaerochaeta pleomorpha]AEV30816.1 glycogen/starch synthase, ADP-glucose type [Sphaerochaeta pleomorpha str. Grapes]
MNIFMVSSESVPFSKSGGLADVVGALSSALSSLGSDVRVLVPCYGNMDISGFSDMTIGIDIPLLGKTERVTFIETELDNVHFYFLCHPWFQNRKGIYGDSSYTPYSDNLERYMLLNKAALPLCKALHWKPEIIHCHDWTCGFIPYLMDLERDAFFSGTASIMTIHNLAYQGDFSRLQLLGGNLQSDKRMFSGDTPEKRVNMLKTGLEFADAITTVSPTYAKEIQTAEYGCKLDHLMRERSNNLCGIINGIDYEEWNPQTDTFFDDHFSREDLQGKAKTKALVQKEFKLPVDPNIPLISMISRIADQKGFVELLEGSPCALEKLVRDYPLQMLIVGTGDERMEKQMLELANRYENLSVNIMFSNRGAHRIEAASDFFLMPSRYEPCGLNQLYSLRYGTLPIARKTGGLADSIIDLDESPQEGTGILFKTISGDAIIEGVKRALYWWEKGSKEMDLIRIRCMDSDATWERSARSYLNIYETSIREKKTW